MVNPDVDDYYETLPKRSETLRKTWKNNNLLETKRILKPKWKLSGDQNSHEYSSYLRALALKNWDQSSKTSPAVMPGYFAKTSK